MIYNGKDIDSEWEAEEIIQDLIRDKKFDEALRLIRIPEFDKLLGKAYLSAQILPKAIRSDAADLVLQILKKEKDSARSEWSYHGLEIYALRTALDEKAFNTIDVLKDKDVPFNVMILESGMAKTLINHYKSVQFKDDDIPTITFKVDI